MGALQVSLFRSDFSLAGVLFEARGVNAESTHRECVENNAESWLRFPENQSNQRQAKRPIHSSAGNNVFPRESGSLFTDALGNR